VRGISCTQPVSAIERDQGESILDNIQEAIIATDSDSYITYWSKGAEYVLGYSKEEVIGKLFKDVLRPSYGAEELENLMRNLERNGRAKILLNVRDKNDTRVVTESSITKVKDANGNVSGFVGVHRDITKREAIENAFHQREEQYRLAMRAARLHSWELRIGTGVLESPEPLEPYLGLPPDSFPGTLESYSKFVHPGDLSRLHRAFSRSIEKGKDLDIEHRIVWPDGSIHWVHEIGAVLFDDDGKPNRLLGILTDITGEKYHEEEHSKLSNELEHEKDMLDILIDHTHAHLAYLDRDFTFLKVNSAYANGCGKTKQELIGKRHFDLFPNEENKRTFTKVLRTGKPVSFIDKPFLLGTDPSRALTYWNYKLEPTKDDDGKVTGLVLSLIDITDLKMHQKEIQKLNHNLIQYASELKAANAELEAFCYSVSHDLRAPLRSMNGFSQALLEDYPDKLDAEGKDYLNRIHGSTEKMSQLIDDLLKLSRLTRSEMHYEEVDLGSLSRSIINNLKKNNPDRDVKLKLHDKLIVNGDENLLRMALENLIGNAWKFTKIRDKAHIEVGKNQLNDETIFYIKDNGAGFDMKYSDKLFIPFQRLHSDKQFEGTGIGLGIVKRIITRHGGRVWAEAEEGVGATFYFTLPTTSYPSS
jgi:PAS domain S-box-containing protein